MLTCKVTCRLYFLGSATPGLAEAETKAVESWLETARLPETFQEPSRNLPETPHRAVEGGPLGPKLSGGDFRLLCAA